MSTETSLLQWKSTQSICQPMPPSCPTLYLNAHYPYPYYARHCMTMVSGENSIPSCTQTQHSLRSQHAICMYFQLSSCLRLDVSNLFILSLDLMSSPRNPLNERVLERSAATFFIIFIINQLFISNNDVIQLDWVEREFFATEKAKWDGALIKADSKCCSAGLIEFSGGLHDQTPSTKNNNDITKLYSKLIKVLNTQSPGTSQTFCVRY